jgi:hypothetical protein
MSSIETLAQAVFDPETLRILEEAFDAVWTRLQSLDATAAREPEAAATRERVAKRLIELGRRGERDHSRLVEDAWAHVVNSKPEGSSPTSD